MNELLNALKNKVVRTLNLQDVNPEEINENDMLIGGDLGIDSIDILELVMMIEQDYGIKIDNKEVGQKVFSTLHSMAEYIYENSPNFQN